MNGLAASAATVRLAAVASTALQPVLARPEGSGTLLGVSDHAAWLSAHGGVIVLGDRAAVRLPNTVELAVDELGRWIDGDDAVSVGDGMISVGPLSAAVRRWFDPRPALGACRVDDLRDGMEMLRSIVGEPADHGLAEALAGGDTAAILNIASGLLGMGIGLTPEGDDLLAGALAAHVLLADAIGRELDYFDGLIQPLTDLAGARTTDFSSALVVHALHGRVSAPVADLLHALTGRGPKVPAVNRLLAVGHTSGAALAAGLLVGGSALTLENAS